MNQNEPILTIITPCKQLIIKQLNQIGKKFGSN